jgi:GT2 family glycosyltransferase
MTCVRFVLSVIILGNVCFSRHLYDDVGGYDESVGMAEDLDLYVRFLIHGHLSVYLPMISHLHRMHQTNFSIGCDENKHHSDLKAIYKRNENKLATMGIKFTLN